MGRPLVDLRNISTFSTPSQPVCLHIFLTQNVWSVRLRQPLDPSRA